MVRPIYYWRRCGKGNIRFSISLRKPLLLATPDVAKAFCVEGMHFRLLSDQRSLKYLRNLKRTTGRLTRWAPQLQQ